MAGETLTGDRGSISFINGRLRRQNKSSPLHRPLFHSLRPPRFIDRFTAGSRDYFLRPPIVVNSLPQSGSELLLEIVRTFPRVRHYGSFLSSIPTIPFRERSGAALFRLIRRIVPGEVVGAHLFFNEACARYLAARHCVHFFVYRDLRDVAVCEAHYLTYRNIWHRLHPFFADLPGDSERISAAIQGFAHERFPYHYPNIGGRFARFEGWLNRQDVMAIAYEDLCSGRLEEVIRAMIRFYALRTGSRLCERHILASVASAVADKELSTQLSSRTRSWVDSFAADHHDQFEEIAGELNRRLGYERSASRSNVMPAERTACLNAG